MDSVCIYVRAPTVQSAAAALPRLRRNLATARTIQTNHQPARPWQGRIAAFPRASRPRRPRQAGWPSSGLAHDGPDAPEQARGRAVVHGLAIVAQPRRPTCISPLGRNRRPIDLPLDQPPSRAQVVGLKLQSGFRRLTYRLWRREYVTTARLGGLASTATSSREATKAGGSKIAHEPGPADQSRLSHLQAPPPRTSYPQHRKIPFAHRSGGPHWMPIDTGIGLMAANSGVNRHLRDASLVYPETAGSGNILKLADGFRKTAHSPP